MTTKYILGQIGENGTPRTIVVEEGVTQDTEVEGTMRAIEYVLSHPDEGSGDIHTDLAKILHHQLQKALRCGKDMGDGSICGCKLDCHLHDWRQRDELQKARTDWLREEIVKLEGMEHHEPNRGFNRSDTLQTIIDRYQAELDQDKQ